MPDSALDFSRLCRDHAEQTALEADHASWSYADFDRLITATADFLLTHDLNPGDRIGIVARNSAEYVAALWAIFRLGGIACLINARLPEASIERSLSELGCTRLLQLTDKNHLPGLPQVDRVILRPLAGLSASSSSPTVLTFDRPATAMQTSGTSGKPKAIVHSIGNLYYSALGSNENIKVSPGDAWLLSLPLYHVGGLGILLRCLSGGATVVVNDSPADQSVPDHITHLSLVPTQLHRILADRPLTGRLASQLKAVLLGGAAPSEKLVHAALEAGLPLHTSYGLTEMSSQVTTTPPGDSCTTSGKLLPYREMRLSRDSEIEVRGKTRFWGTIEDGALTPRSPSEWYSTGDIGSLAPDDSLTVIGRVDSRFKCGGEIVQPETVERELSAIDGIDDILVVGMPDVEFGHRPVALVRWSGKPLAKDTLDRRLERTLPRYSLPIAYVDWPPELLTAGIKPSRSEATRLVRERLSR